MLKSEKKCTSFKEQSFAKENKKSIEYSGISFFGMQSTDVINYSTVMCCSCPCSMVLKFS